MTLKRFRALIAFGFILLSQGIQGSEIDISAYKGKVVYVDFWASWCSPCVQSFPFMNDLHDKYQKDGLVVLAINLDTEPKAAAAFLEQHPAKFEIMYDPEAKLAKAYELKAMPTSYIYDRQGQLLGSHLGFKKRDVAELENQIRAVLAINNKKNN